MKIQILQLKIRTFIPILIGLLCSLGVYSQNITVKGRVQDAQTGEPIIGASILVKGAGSGTMTDIDGNFQIQASQGATISVSYIGYATKDVPAQANVTIALNSDAIALTEVVAIGYGTVRKKDLSGAVTAIKPEELNRGAITSPQQLLQGKVSGVFVQPGNGQPGGGSTLRIRSGASLNASNDPLIVIDGVPVSNDAAPGMANGLAAINPNDIETFTVLKDASATAIFGSRASNGVIIITTKKGLTGEGGKGKNVLVSYNSTYSLSDPYNKIKTLDAGQYREVVTNTFGSDDTAMSLLNQYPDQATNWQDQVYQTAFGTDQNLSVAGNVLDTPYRISFGYTNEDGTIKTSNFERYTADLGITRKFFRNHLDVAVNVKGSLNNNVFVDAEPVVGSAAFFDPTKPMYNDTGLFNGYWNWTTSEGRPNTQAPTNPLSLLFDRNDTGKTLRSIGNIQLDYKMHFLPELHANLNLGYDVAEGKGTGKGGRQGSVQVAKDTDFPNLGQIEDWRNIRRNHLLDFYLNYDKDFKTIESRLNVMGGYSWQHFYLSDNNRTYTYTDPNLTTLKDGWTRHEEGYYVKDGTGISKPKEYFLLSFFGRMNYSLMDRYLVTATLRRDGSSRFSEENRWGLFPSVALAWTISSESFMENLTVMNNLKLRVSYGETGQQDIGDNYYPYIPNYLISTNPNSTYLGQYLIKPMAYNPNLKWETTKTYNIGLDYGFLNNRINGSIEYYIKKTSDLLFETDVAAGTNFTNRMFANIGNMENKGVEFNLNATAIDTKDFVWDLGFNITWNKSRVTNLTIGNNPDFPGIPVNDISAGTGGPIAKQMVGYAPNTFFTYQQVYDENGNPIQNVFVDRNGDGQITEADRYLNYNPMPDWYLGFNSRFTYKQFDLGFNFRANIGNHVYNDVVAGNSTVQNAYGGRGSLTNLHEAIYTTGFTNVNTSAQNFSDYFVENASFLKMDNITLGYNFAKLITQKLSGRISFSVQNVFTVTEYSGLDPEIPGPTGIDKNIWPRPRIFTVGLNLNF